VRRGRWMGREGEGRKSRDCPIHIFSPRGCKYVFQ